MRPRAILLALAAATGIAPQAIAQSQTASGLSITVNSIQTTPFAEAIVTVRNSSNTAYSHIFIECAFLSATGEPITLANEMITNVGPGQTVYGKAQIGTRPGIKSASCRISSTQP